MIPNPFSAPRVLAAAAALSLSTAALAVPVDITVKIENRAPGNSISFAPFNFGFGAGTFDAFNAGQAAGAPVVTLAETGNGGPWRAAFSAADAAAVTGFIDGALLPGHTATSTTLRIDTDANPYFSFAAMALPSNDFFIGNDSPTAYRLFDMAGHLQLASIDLMANQIWDAGSETFDPAAAAFYGDAALRTAQNGVVTAGFSELSGFNGLTTAAGYVFDSQLTADTDVYRVSFQVTAVPEPQTYAMLGAGLLLVGAMARRRSAAGPRAD